MRSETISVHTGDRPRCTTSPTPARIRRARAGDGLLNVFVPHATAGVAILETGAGSDEDLLAGSRTSCRAAPVAAPARLARARARSRAARTHRAVDHRAGLGGAPALGTWQSICLVDTNVDNAERTVPAQL